MNNKKIEKIQINILKSP